MLELGAERPPQHASARGQHEAGQDPGGIQGAGGAQWRNMLPPTDLLGQMLLLPSPQIDAEF